MQTVLPYTTSERQMQACEQMKLINAHAATSTGPYVALRSPKLVVGGLLHNWDADAAAALRAPPAQSVHTWDVRWTDEEAYWEANVHRCTAPEEVEALLPAKWLAYRVETDVDETLARVCTLCTSLVDRFVALSHGDGATASTTKWRQRQALYDRLGAVMELLEASIGEAIPLLKLREPEFVRQCWSQLQEDERQDMVSALRASADSHA